MEAYQREQLDLMLFFQKEMKPNIENDEKKNIQSKFARLHSTRWWLL